MARVLLISPPYSQAYGSYRASARQGVLWPPLGLAYLAANLDPGHEVRILDMEVRPDLDAALEEVRPEFVGVGFTTPLVPAAQSILARVKRFDQGIHTVVGGAHPTARPDETARFPGVDSVIPGEAEAALNAFLRRPQRGVRAPAPLLRDIDELKFPARHLLQNTLYRFSVPGHGIVPLTSFMTTRGCPYRCTFCGQHLTFGRRVRFRSIENCIAELRQLRSMGLRHLTFLDDTLGLDTARTLALCERIVSEGLDITFQGFTRVNVITRELLSALKRAGLVRLSFGVESGNQQLLDAVRKGTHLSQIRKAYELADEAGIETRMSIILGLPGESTATIKETIRFMKSLPCRQAYVNIATPYPGTELFEDAVRGNGGLHLTSTDWASYRRYGNAVIRLGDLDERALVRWQRRALAAFYLRPKIIKYHVQRAGLRAFLENGLAFARTMVTSWMVGARPGVAGQGTASMNSSPPHPEGQTPRPEGHDQPPIQRATRRR